MPRRCFQPASSRFMPLLATSFSWWCAAPLDGSQPALAGLSGRREGLKPIRVPGKPAKAGYEEEMRACTHHLKVVASNILNPTEVG